MRAVGEAIDGFAVGDPVCALTTRGGYAEVAVAPAAMTYRLTGSLASDLERAAAMPTIVPTAHALVHEVARLRAGERVLVHAAAGGVGTLLGQIASLVLEPRLAGCHRRWPVILNGIFIAV